MALEVYNPESRQFSEEISKIDDGQASAANPSAQDKKPLVVRPCKKLIELSAKPMKSPRDTDVISSTREYLALVEQFNKSKTEIEQQSKEKAKQAHRIGFQQGYADGIEQARNDIALANAEIELIEHKLIPKLLENLSPKIETIVSTLCQEVLAREIDKLEHFAAPRIKRMLQTDELTGPLNIRVSSLYDSKQIESFKNLIEKSTSINFEIRKQDGLDKDELHILSPQGKIVLSITNQLNNLLRRLSSISNVTDGFYRDIIIRELLEIIE